MAWVQRLPSGRYRGLYRDGQGRSRVAPGGPFTHKAAAQRAAAEAEGKARRSIWRDPDAAKRPLSEWVTEWWPTRTIGAGTLKAQASYRDQHLLPRFGRTPLGSIRRQDVRAWAAELARSGLAPATVQRCVHLLSAALTAAVDAELIDANPAARLKLPKPPPAQERFLTRAEFAAIADQLPTLHDRLIAETLAYTGLRWGELAGLHRDRVHLDRGLFRIVETFNPKTGAMEPVPKGRRVRDVPVPGWLADELQRLEQADVTCRRPHVAGRCRSGLLFTTARGNVVWESKWATRFRAAVDRAGVGHVRPHDLRHTYASWLLQAGRPLAEVGKLMGHESTATTQRYAWLEDVDHSHVSEALGAPLERPNLAVAATNLLHQPPNGVHPTG